MSRNWAAESARPSNDRPEFFRACFAAFGGGGPVAMAVGERVRIDDLGAVPANIDVRAWFP